jgi:hypothetical protein
MVNLHGEPQSREDAKKENLHHNPLLLCVFAVNFPNVKGMQKRKMQL